MLYQGETLHFIQGDKHIDVILREERPKDLALDFQGKTLRFRMTTA